MQKLILTTCFLVGFVFGQTTNIFETLPPPTNNTQVFVVNDMFNTTTVVVRHPYNEDYKFVIIDNTYQPVDVFVSPNVNTVPLQMSPPEIKFLEFDFEKWKKDLDY